MEAGEMPHAIKVIRGNAPPSSQWANAGAITMKIGRGLGAEGRIGRQRQPVHKAARLANKKSSHKFFNRVRVILVAGRAG
jgi:hypothetical protein